jgi:O-acetyl-ADP-ribose deacetylase
MTIKLIQGDITELKVDAIVNAANTSLLGGGGVDGAIHRKAGKELYEECILLGGCDVGEAKITKGYKLPAKHIIHTVGPFWREGVIGEKDKLKLCYQNSLTLLVQNHLQSIAFPCISTGAYLFPSELAVNIAIDTVEQFLISHPTIDVTFCCFLEEDFKLYQSRLNPSKSSFFINKIKNFWSKS